MTRIIYSATDYIYNIILVEGEKEMRFCDKLPKLRKENNLSQEQLADRLGVSRQAVSKWEQGLSYPDMEKILELCSILNCTLDKLLDDGVVGEVNSNKISFNDYLNNFLKFITNSTNMFFSMSFKQKIVFLFETFILTLILTLIAYVTFNIATDIIHSILFFIPLGVRYSIYSILDSTIFLGLFILVVISLVHIFKVRYLDYYVTVEDANTNEKTLEKEVDETPHKKERIIIRDYKHNAGGITKMLGKTALMLVKLIAIFIIMFFILSFLFLLIILSLSMFHIKYSIIFLYTSLVLLGLLSISYLFIKVLYNFILNLKSNFKTIFYIFITSLAVIGLFTGCVIYTYLGFKKVPSSYDRQTITETVELNYENNIVLDFLYDDNTELIVDNSLDNIKLEVIYPEDYKYHLYHYNDKYYGNDYLYYGITCYNNSSFLGDVSILTDDIRKKQRRDYLFANNYIIKVYTSLDSLNKLKENYSILY